MAAMREEITKSESRKNILLYAFIVAAAIVLSKLIVWISGAH